MAQAVFNSCSDVMPDIDEQFLRHTIVNMINDFGIAQVHPDANFADIFLPPEAVDVVEFTTIVLDRLLNDGYQRRVEEAPAQVAAAVAAGPVNVAVPNRQSNYMDRRRYREESLALLQNEFKWFYVNAIQRALGSRNSNYTEARKLLQEIVKPYAGDLNLDTIDPLHPAYPMRNLLPLRLGRQIEHPIHGVFKLLQTPRQSRAIAVENPELREEIESFRKALESKDHSFAEEINFQEYENESMLIACQCCFADTTFESLVACAEGHLFCLPCLKEYVNVRIEVGVKKGQLECMENTCDATFPRSILSSRLEPEVLEKLDERIFAYNLNASGMSDLVRCPKCQMQYQLEPNEKVLICANCKHASCRRCQEPWDKDHIGKSCEEIEGKSEIRLRRAYEEEMTKALVRTCPKCRTEILKTEGCNKMTCPCGGTLCYACKAPMINYEHFCKHVRDPGRSCTQCSMCSLYVDPTKTDEANIQKLEAEARRKQQEEREARAKKLLEAKLEQPGPSGIQPADRKRPLSSIAVGFETEPLPLKKLETNMPGGQA